MPSKNTALKHSTYLFAYLLIVWGFYRFLIQLPEETEELFIKPIIWLLPTLFLVYRERGKLADLGISLKKLFPAIYFSLALGALFVLEGVMVNYLKYGGLNFNANIGGQMLLVSLTLSFATATTEEITFRGYIFNRLWYGLGNEWLANVISSIGWALIHVPVTVFVWKLPLSAALVYLMLTTLFGFGSAFVFARTRNVFGSIFLHVLWEWPIILFR